MANFCGNCGTKVDSSWKVCPNCGSILEKEEIAKYQQNQNVQQGYQPPTQPYIKIKTSNNNSKNALILGVVGFITTLIPVIGLLLGILAIIYGILGIHKEDHAGMAVAGLILGVFAVLISILVIRMFINLLS